MIVHLSVIFSLLSLSNVQPILSEITTQETTNGWKVVCIFSPNQWLTMTASVSRELCHLTDDTGNNTCQLLVSDPDCEQRLHTCGLLEEWKSGGNDSSPTSTALLTSLFEGEICCVDLEIECEPFPPTGATAKISPASSTILMNNSSGGTHNGLGPERVAGITIGVLVAGIIIGVLVAGIVLFVYCWFSSTGPLHGAESNGIDNFPKGSGKDNERGGDGGNTRSGTVPANNTNGISNSVAEDEDKQDQSHAAYTIEDNSGIGVQSGPPPPPLSDSPEEGSDTEEPVGFVTPSLGLRYRGRKASNIQAAPRPPLGRSNQERQESDSSDPDPDDYVHEGDGFAGTPAQDGRNQVHTKSEEEERSDCDEEDAAHRTHAPVPAVSQYAQSDYSPTPFNRLAGDGVNKNNTLCDDIIKLQPEHDSSPCSKVDLIPPQIRTTQYPVESQESDRGSSNEASVLVVITHSESTKKNVITCLDNGVPPLSDISNPRLCVPKGFSPEKRYWVGTIPSTLALNPVSEVSEICEEVMAGSNHSIQVSSASEPSTARLMGEKSHISLSPEQAAVPRVRQSNQGMEMGRIQNVDKPCVLLQDKSQSIPISQPAVLSQVSDSSLDMIGQAKIVSNDLCSDQIQTHSHDQQCDPILTEDGQFSKESFDVKPSKNNSKKGTEMAPMCKYQRSRGNHREDSQMMIMKGFITISVVLLTIFSLLISFVWKFLNWKQIIHFVYFFWVLCYHFLYFQTNIVPDLNLFFH